MQNLKQGLIHAISKLLVSRKNNWLPTDRRPDRPSYGVAKPQLKIRAHGSGSPQLRLVRQRIYLLHSRFIPTECTASQVKIVKGLGAGNCSKD